MNKRNCFLLILLCFVVVLLSSCGGVNKKTLKRMQMMEEGVEKVTTTEELENAIQKYERRVEEMIVAQEQIGVWYKMLATRYLEQKMYGEALGALEKAIQYYPANQNLFYYVGVSAGYMANASLDFRATNKTDRDSYLLLAESGYLRAIELQPSYVRALYGLAVLYTFEMNQPAKAIPLVEKLLTIETKHIDGMFVLARAYYMTYSYEEAVAVYDKIINTSTSKENREKAEENKKVVLDAMYQ